MSAKDVTDPRLSSPPLLTYAPPHSRPFLPSALCCSRKLLILTLKPWIMYRQGMQIRRRDVITRMRGRRRDNLGASREHCCLAFAALLLPFPLRPPCLTVSPSMLQSASPLQRGGNMQSMRG